jgi:hypothetical protein
MERLRKVLDEPCRPSIERVLTRSFWTTGERAARASVTATTTSRSNRAEEHGSAESFQEL